MAINIDLLADLVPVIPITIINLLFMVAELLVYQSYGIDRSDYRSKLLITNHQAIPHFEDLMGHVLPLLPFNVFEYLF